MTMNTNSAYTEPHLRRVTQLVMFVYKCHIDFLTLHIAATYVHVMKCSTVWRTLATCHHNFSELIDNDENMITDDF